jgi:hypothetical protein
LATEGSEFERAQVAFAAARELSSIAAGIAIVLPRVNLVR